MNSAKPQNRRIAFVGRSSGPKGERLKTLFNSGLFSFLEKHPDWQFDIIASKPEEFGSTFLERICSWKTPQQIRVLGKVKNLSEQLAHYDIVLGAGRVAVESLLQNCAVIAFGEYTSYGLVTKDNLLKNLASNFGDMGPDAHEGPLQEEQILNDLESLVTGKAQTNAPDILARLKQEYNEDLINPEVIEIYKAAIFKRKVPGGIPALMYHKIPETEPKTQHRIFVTAQNFEKHLRFFSKQGFKTLNFSELSEFWDLRRPYSEFPQKPLLLTFDDGYKDNLYQALPLLHKYGAKAVLYLLSDLTIRENTWDLAKDSTEPRAELLSPEERGQVAQNGIFEIGSHGMSHKDLTQLSDDEVLAELTQSKCKLEAEFHKPVLSLAYPFGAVDERLPRLAKTAGYLFAVNTDQGGLHFADQPWGVFRVNIFPEETIFSLWKKTSPWYRKRFFRKYGK